MLTRDPFALNEAYFLTDKGALEGIEAFPRRPDGYAGAVRDPLGRPGPTPTAPEATAARLEDLHGEVAARCAAWTPVPVPRWPTV